jgi:HSP20 family protein
MWRQFVKEIGTKSREVYELLTPPIDIFEDGSDLVVVVDLPGFEKKRIKTRLNTDTLVVSATREPEEYDGIAYWEQRPLKLRKIIRLPVKVKHEDEEAVGKATYENGVLTVRLPIKGVGRVELQ